VQTERLRLRRWRDEDRTPFAALNADPEVMEFFPAKLSRAESDAFIDKVEAMFDARGYGLWAVDDTDGFIGYVGLWPAEFPAHFTPAVEIGWRLARSAWGKGYATEAARRALEFGFDELGLSAIVSFTAVLNVRSQRVMQRIGMVRDTAGDFDHPNVPAGHRLRPHVLYRLGREP
jgi:ribosomal-protein-alanine N-acetyltransferase